MDVPTSRSERERVVPVASGVRASAVPPSETYWQVKVAQLVGVYNSGCPP